ncbi:MAG: hypothetical protein EAZ27_07485 [Cytophagales bacterium]|nr:MAG: hypothetical protein EAZ27_07485 [Cytophagales bacterium]
MSKHLNLDKILEDFSNEIGGKVIPYTDSQSIIIMPTSHGRFQRVLGYTRISKSQKVKFLEFDSKVCEFSDSIDMKKYLTEAAHHTFSRIIIKDGFLQIASSVIVEHATADLIKDMVKEVAEVADELEFQITGKDEN